MTPTDVLVVGSGMAGLVAALTASLNGKRTRILARGSGALAVNSGTVDMLGYLDGEIVRGNPLDALDSLSSNHPYRLIGRKAVEETFEFFSDVCSGQGLPLSNPHGENAWVPTILGTFKPTWLCSSGLGREALVTADAVVVARMPWLKDCQADITLHGLQRQKRLRDKRRIIHTCSPHQGPSHRKLSSLDMARYVDSSEGRQWLLEQLKDCVTAAGTAHPAILVPPVLGIDRHADVRRALTAALPGPVLEMAVPPPGVGGLRIRRALLKALSDNGVTIEENITVCGAEISGSRCSGLYSIAPDKRRQHQAKAFIIATGGFFGGGSQATPGGAHETIFNLDLGAPLCTDDWSVPDVFASQPYARLGVRVNERLNPVSANGETLLDNVFFAGRSLAGYDFVTEKSGNGVALCSGRHAALQL